MTTDRVCYQDGWHWSVVADENGNDVPGEKLFLDDDGSYRPAVDGDVSWHDRKHQRFVTVEMEDGAQPGLSVSPDELVAIQALLAERRGS